MIEFWRRRQKLTGVPIRKGLTSGMLPVAIMGIIIAIDPIVDMARTLVNVNDSIVAGLITARRIDSLNKETLNDSTKVVESTL